MRIRYLIFLVFGFAPSLLRAQCDCISDFNFSSETLPSATISTSCPEPPGYRSFEHLNTRYGGPSHRLLDPIPASVSYMYISPSFNKFVDGTTRAVRAYHGVPPRSQSCTESVTSARYTLSGWNIIALNFWYRVTVSEPSGRCRPCTPEIEKHRLQDGVMSTRTEAFPVSETNLPTVQAFFSARGGASLPIVPGLSFAAYPRSFTLQMNGANDVTYTPSNISNPGGGGVNTGLLLDDIEETLRANGWTNFTAGIVRVGGRYYPAILKQFGEEKTVYANYGRFKDANEARLYGYTTADQLYFSKAQTVPAEETEYTTPDLRFGSTIYSRDEVLAHRDDVEWHDQCRCSDMAYNPNDFNEPTIEDNQNWTPIAPDNIDNQNSPSFKTCPDHRTYYTLYAKCLERELADVRLVPDPRGRVDYSDYLHSKLTEDPAYKSLNPDLTLENEALSTSAMPETPAYYDKSGERLNPSVSDNMDPLDPNTKFYARGFEDGFLGIGEDEVDIDVSGDARPVILDVGSFFTQVVAGGKLGILGFFGLDDSYHEDVLKFSKTFGSLEVTFAIDNVTYFKENWKLLNTRDKYLEYKTPRTFITQSNTGRPIKVKMHDDNLFTREFQKFDVYWDYDLFYVNRFGDPTKIGSIRLEKYIHYNWNHTDWSDNTKELKMKGGKTMPAADQYDMASREAHTDLKKLEDRDPATFDDKAEAVAKIAYYIAVSEGLDMGMKWLYNQRDKPYIYEAAKRLENMAAVKQTAKVAYVMYKGYVEWRRLMDILGEIRDSRRALEKSFSRFKRSTGLLVDHFVNLDYSAIRPTNITMLYPTRAVRYFDWSTQELKYNLLHYELAWHALNLDLDRFVDGPGKKTLAYLYKETTGGLATVDGENAKERETTHRALREAQGVLATSEDNTSNYIRLSALTRLAIQKTKNTKVKSLEASTTGLRNVLVAIQSDSRDWLTMQDYATHNLAGSPRAITEAFNDRSPEAISDQFNVAPVFKNKWVDEKMEELEPTP